MSRESCWEQIRQPAAGGIKAEGQGRGEAWDTGRRGREERAEGKTSGAEEMSGRNKGRHRGPGSGHRLGKREERRVPCLSLLRRGFSFITSEPLQSGVAELSGWVHC